MGVRALIHAIIDIGSNTVRMAIYLINHDSMELLTKKKVLLGLAAYLKDGRMTARGIDKVVEVLDGFQDFLRSLSITHATAFTTAALRNAVNSAEAVAEIRARTGIEVHVIPGSDEAAYDFIGVTHNIEDDTGLIFDIGGASTEAVYYRGRAIVEKVSMPMGSLLFATKYSHGLLPDHEEIERMRGEAAYIFGESGFTAPKGLTAAGIGGTFKGLSALYHGIYGDSGAMDTERLPEIMQTFGAGSSDEASTILLLRSVPDRIHTIIPGLVIASAVLSACGCRTVTYTDSGMREGYIYKEILKTV